MTPNNHLDDEHLAFVVKAVAALEGSARLRERDWELLQPVIGAITRTVGELNQLVEELDVRDRILSPNEIAIFRLRLRSIMELSSRETGSLAASVSTVETEGKRFLSNLVGWYLGTALWGTLERIRTVLDIYTWQYMFVVRPPPQPIIPQIDILDVSGRKII